MLEEADRFNRPLSNRPLNNHRHILPLMVVVEVAVEEEAEEEVEEVHQDQDQDQDQEALPNKLECPKQEQMAP